MILIFISIKTLVLTDNSDLPECSLVDSDKKDAFDAKHYDVPMTQGLADGLYTLMLKLLEIKKRVTPNN